MPGGFPGVNWNVRPRVYCAVMSQYILSADAPRPLRRFTVTVTLPRPDGEDVLMPPGAQAAAERAAAAVAADGLLTAWTSARAVLSMVIVAPCQADALTAGAAVARALVGERGAAVRARAGNPWFRVGAAQAGLVVLPDLPLRVRGPERAPAELGW